MHTLVASAALLVACGAPEEEYGVVESELAVGTYVTSSCTTSVVIGLSKQIADEVGCMNAGALVKFNPSANLQITSSAVLPYLNETAKTRLEQVAATRVVRVNSAFRTVAQQYLIYRWFQLGRCGITAAATPGRSNHEGGRALDLANYNELISPMAARGWAHNVPGDPVHFEYLGAPDIRGRDVLAFQRLWNRNNPGDQIAEDGAYGPQTEARLRAAPATGFPTGALCGTRDQALNVVMIDGPDKLAPGTKATYAITLHNTGALEWPATTKLVVAGGAASELYDAASWASAKEVGPIGAAIPAGAQGVVELTLAAPPVGESTPYFTQFALASSGAAFGTIDIGVTVTPYGDHDTSSESDDMHDDGADVHGGCNTGGGASWLALVIPAVLLRPRRRTRR